MADTAKITTVTKPTPSLSNEEANGDRKRKFDETLIEGKTAGNYLGEKKIKEEKVDSGYEKTEQPEKKEDEGEKKSEQEIGEEFAYSKRGDFTSEVYKIIVKGLPRYFGIGVSSKLLI